MNIFKRCALLCSIVLLLPLSLHAGDFWRSGAGRATEDALRSIDREAGNYVRQKEREMEELQRVLDRPIAPKGNLSDAEYQAILDETKAQKRRAEEKLKRLQGHADWAEQAMQGLVGSFVGGIKGNLDKAENERKARENLRQTAVQENIRSEGLVAAEKERGKGRLEELKQQGEETRKNIAALIEIFNDAQKRNNFIKFAGLSTAVIAGAYYGVKFVSYVAEDLYRVPALAEKTTILTSYEKLYNWLFDIDPPFDVTLDDVILTKDLEGFFRGFVKSTRNTVDNGGFCRHLLLPGPPGTGKTMMSFALANELGLPAIYFNAGKLSNCSVEDALVRIEKLFSYAEHSDVPIVIIIDEAEVIFKHRNSPGLTEKTRLIMNDIMAKTGTEQNNFILIGLTNRPDDFDPAFKSRFSEIIYINPPSLEQRIDMLEKYIDQYLINPVFTPKKSWRNFFRKTESKNNKIVISKDVLTKQEIEDIARKFNEFSGRDISQFVLGLREEAYAQDHPTVDRELRDRVVARKLEKKQRELASQQMMAPAA